MIVSVLTVLLCAGLHRPVKLYTTPLSVHVDDVTVVSSLLGNGSAVVTYKVDVFTSGTGQVELHLSLEERQGGPVAEDSLLLPNCPQPGGCVVTGKGQLVVKTPRLWWPWTMSPDDPGYLYTLEVGSSTCIIASGTWFSGSQYTCYNVLVVANEPKKDQCRLLYL